MGEVVRYFRSESPVVNIPSTRAMVTSVVSMYRDFETNMMVTNRRLDRVDVNTEEERYLENKQNLSREILGQLDDLRLNLEQYIELMRR